MTYPRILAIDPGDTHSAYVITGPDLKPVDHEKILNQQILDGLTATDPHLIPLDDVDYVAIEMIASYGMPVGAEIFQTCLWIGRFMQVLIERGYCPALVYRRDIKLHHCGTTAAKDPNVTRALVDRFTPGQPNFGKGTKADPGWFHGFHRDIWQSYAVAVYIADQYTTGELR